MKISAALSAFYKLPKRRGELLFGLAPCLLALQAKRRQVYSVILQDGFGMKGKGQRDLRKLVLNEVNKVTQNGNVKLCYVDKEKLKSLIGKDTPHQGILLDVQPLSIKTVKSVDKMVCSDACPPFWLILYQVQDPMNFGAILRCAYFFGVDKVVISDRSCCLSPTVSKASSGAMELLSVSSSPDTISLLKDAKGSGWEVLGAISSKQSQVMPVFPIEDYQLTKPTVLVVGNEGYGLSCDLEGCCTAGVTINSLRSLPDGFDSLNVGVATGIILKYLKNQSSANIKR